MTSWQGPGVVRTAWARVLRRKAHGSRRMAVAGVAALAFTAAACGGGGAEGGGGGGGGGEGTITFANWASAEQTTRPGIRALIKEFEAQNPGITVKSEAISFSDIGRQLVLRTQSGNPPDVAQISGNDTAAVAATGALAPLDDFVDDALRSRINEADIEAGTYDDELVAFPWTDSPQGFWYNKDIMREAGLDPSQPPATIDELMSAMKAIKKAQPDVVGLGLDATNRSFGLDSNWAWMQTFGAEPLSDGEANADTPELQEYLSWMREMATNDYIQPGLKIGDFRPMAAQGQVAFMWDQNLLQGVIQDANGMSDQEFYDTWGVTTLPQGQAGESFAVGLGHQLVVFGSSEEQEAAWKFVEFLSTSEQAILDYTIPVAASLPPLADPQGKVAQKLDTPVNDKFFDEIIPTLVRPPYGRDYTQAFGPIMVGVQQAITGSQPIDSITGSMQSELESALG